MTQLKSFQERHQWHVKKLEQILRKLDNDELDMTDLAIVRDSVEYYIEAHAEPEYQHDEALYDCFDLQEVEDKATKPRTPSMDATKDKDSNAATKDDSQRKGKEKER